jgi:hypothetical protein
MSPRPDKPAQVGFERELFQFGCGDQVAATKDLFHGGTSCIDFAPPVERLHVVIALRASFPLGVRVRAFFWVLINRRSAIPAVLGQRK